MEKLQVMNCPFCGSNMAIRYGCNTDNIAIGCDNLKCINSAMNKIPVPEFNVEQAVEIWNTRFENDTMPTKLN